MYVAVLDIVQYDCPVVRLTELLKDIEIVVLGANVSEIHRGYERIYISIRGDNKYVIERSLDNIRGINFVKSFTVLYRKNNEARIYMHIKKTNAMEASVKLDAVPVAPWVSVNGVERWTLGFFSKKQLYNYVSMVREKDVIENIIIKEVPDEAVMYMSLLYPALLNFLTDIRELTENQIKILKIALDEGYYEWPRRINTVELATKLGISRTGVTKLLRRAEHKALKSIRKILEAISALEHDMAERKARLQENEVSD